jgi:hypothetical protein
MTHAIITTQFELDGVSIEVDGDYWRYEDESVQDLTLCHLWVHHIDEKGITRSYDLLKGLDRPSRLIVERNLFKIHNIEELLCRDIEAQGEDLHIEPDYDPKMDD